MGIPAALGHVQIVEGHTLGAHAEIDLENPVAGTKAMGDYLLFKGGS
jgi:hypothetical protein